MKNIIILGGISALSTGILIGLQSLLSGRAGSLVGPINTAFWTNFLGGCLAGLLMLGIGTWRGFNSVQIMQPAFWMVLTAGALGILIVMGVSFSISKAGVTAGLAAVIWGQMAFGLIADTLGWGGMDPIPLDARRAAGLAIMAISLFFLLPRK